MPEQPDFIKDSTEQMALIPAGELLMGSADKPTWILRFLESMSEGKDEKPPHKVYLKNWEKLGTQYPFPYFYH